MLTVGIRLRQGTSTDHTLNTHSQEEQKESKNNKRSCEAHCFSFFSFSPPAVRKRSFSKKKKRESTPILAAFNKGTCDAVAFTSLNAHHRSFKVLQLGACLLLLLLLLLLLHLLLSAVALSLSLSLLSLSLLLTSSVLGGKYSKEK